jgi:hypothetical protein
MVRLRGKVIVVVVHSVLYGLPSSPPEVSLRQRTALLRFIWCGLVFDFGRRRFPSGGYR